MYLINLSLLHPISHQSGIFLGDIKYYHGALLISLKQDTCLSKAQRKRNNGQ